MLLAYVKTRNGAKRPTMHRIILSKMSIISKSRNPDLESPLRASNLPSSFNQRGKERPGELK